MIYWLLSESPVWLTAFVLWFAIDVVLYLMRSRLEGLGYHESYSGKIGDGCLITAVLVAATIVQRSGAPVPDWLTWWETQCALLLACVCLGVVGFVVTKDKRSAQAGDFYHDVVTFPFLLFSAVTLIPVVWEDGRWWEQLVVLASAIIWMSLVWYDVRAHRMNQRQWLVRNGFPIKGEGPDWKGD